MNWPSSCCARCRFRREIRSARGSAFWLCERSREDPRFPKYPPQPLLRCAGFEPEDQPQEPPSRM
ncbi:MAG: hypothetical protein NW241_07585 [Bacteroidia bacterium]|nr:hypothetical protein [Bacteroidia bacterium]